MTQRKKSPLSPFAARPFAVASLALGLSVGGGCRLCGDSGVSAPVAFEAAFPQTTALRGQTSEPLPTDEFPAAALAPNAVDAPFPTLDPSFPVFDPASLGPLPDLSLIHI